MDINKTYWTYSKMFVLGSQKKEPEREMSDSVEPNIVPSWSCMVFNRVWPDVRLSDNPVWPIVMCSALP